MDKCTKKNLYCKNKNYVTSVFQKTSNKMKGQEETGEKDVRQKKKKGRKINIPMQKELRYITTEKIKSLNNGWGK